MNHLDTHRRYCVEIQVEPGFIPDLSDVTQNRFVFSYLVTMKNTGDIACQLLTRYWFVRESQLAYEVEGPGVVGEFPILHPNQSYQYSSGVSLSATNGLMQGYYEWMAFDGKIFRSTIPVFELIAK